jgi:hypothetical protein
MLRSVKKLEGFTIAATDGEIGKVKDFYFDDQAWVLRYLIVHTGAWLSGKQVLISPYSIKQPGWASDMLPASISKEQIRNSPGIDSDKPISRQYEQGYLGYYGYPDYWGGVGLWGDTYYPGTQWAGMDYDDYDGYRGYLRSALLDRDGDPHLRSCNAVKGYHIHASDGEIGQVAGFLIDDATWSIRYMIVNTSNWWMGHKVLVSPEWIERVSWIDMSVKVALTRQSIKDAPPFSEDALLDRNYEADMYAHYGRDPYWKPKAQRNAA